MNIKPRYALNYGLRGRDPDDVPEQVALVEKSYDTPFVLDSSKLSRIVAIAEERLTEAKVTVAGKFEVLLASGRRALLDHQEDLYRLDNTVNDRVTNLLFHAGSQEPPSSSFIEVEFGPSYRGDISLAVASADPGWALRVFAELDEQVERTKAPSWVHSLRSYIPFIVFGALLIFIFLVAAFYSPRLFNDDRPSWSPAPSEIRELLARAGNATSDSSRLALLLEIRRRELAAQIVPTTNRHPKIPSLPRELFQVLPLLIIVGATGYVIIYCYPRHVFAWGDIAGSYATLVARRNWLWSVVIIALILGILGNLFVSSLTFLR
jgi:hypothetical protein